MYTCFLNMQHVGCESSKQEKRLRASLIMGNKLTFPLPDWGSCEFQDHVNEKIDVKENQESRLHV